MFSSSGKWAVAGAVVYGCRRWERVPVDPGHFFLGNYFSGGSIMMVLFEMTLTSSLSLSLKYRSHGRGIVTA